MTNHSIDESDLASEETSPETPRADDMVEPDPFATSETVSPESTVETIDPEAATAPERVGGPPIEFDENAPRAHHAVLKQFEGLAEQEQARMAAAKKVSDDAQAQFEKDLAESKKLAAKEASIETAEGKKPSRSR